MCEYCQRRPFGKEINVVRKDNGTIKTLQVCKHEQDIDGGLLIWGNYNTYHGYIDINYCPMCGEKLC